MADSIWGGGALIANTGRHRFPEVAEYVRTAIGRATDSPAFRKLLVDLMSRTGRVLSSSSPAKWPVFVLEPCRALGGDPARAIPAAAAVELAVAAIDVGDDLIDGEWGGEGRENTRALNASLALGWLAQRCALDLAESIGTERAARIAALIADGGMGSCAGQDLDLLLEGVPEASEELAHEMTGRKSGSLVAMACQVGAATAVDDALVITIVGTFGFHAGIVAQILNDIAGAKAGFAACSGDLQRRKKTLPVAFAIRCAREERLAGILDWARETHPLTEKEEEGLASAIDELGGLHFAWVIADTHRRQALATLGEIAQATGRSEVLNLRQLLPSIRARRRKRQ